MSESKLDSLRKHGLIGCVSMSEPIKIKTDLWEVLKAHSGTIKILHTLTPIGVCMADDRVKEPYKD